MIERGDSLVGDAEPLLDRLNQHGAMAFKVRQEKEVRVVPPCLVPQPQILRRLVGQGPAATANGLSQLHTDKGRLLNNQVRRVLASSKEHRSIEQTSFKHDR